LSQDITNQNKKILIAHLTENLPVLRAKLKISQAELAEKIGVTRQTLTAIESGKREMTWATFVALTLLFMQNKTTKELLPVVNVYTEELKRFFSFNQDQE